DTAANKKEFDALQHEIAGAREKCAALEDEILATMGEIDEQTAQIPVVEKELAAVRAESATAEQDALDRHARLTKELQDTLALLAEAEKGVPETVRKIYDKQIAVHGADGIAVVQERTCMACYASLTQQQQRELEGGMFGTCKN